MEHSQVFHDRGGAGTISEVVATRHDEDGAVRPAFTLCLRQQDAQPTPPESILVYFTHVHRCGPALAAPMIYFNAERPTQEFGPRLAPTCLATVALLDAAPLARHIACRQRVAIRQEASTLRLRSQLLLSSLLARAHGSLLARGGHDSQGPARARVARGARGASWWRLRVKLAGLLGSSPTM